MLRGIGECFAKSATTKTGLYALNLITAAAVVILPLLLHLWFSESDLRVLLSFISRTIRLTVIVLILSTFP